MSNTNSSSKMMMIAAVVVCFCLFLSSVSSGVLMLFSKGKSKKAGTVASDIGSPSPSPSSPSPIANTEYKLIQSDMWMGNGKDRLCLSVDEESGIFKLKGRVCNPTDDKQLFLTTSNVEKIPDSFIFNKASGKALYVTEASTYDKASIRAEPSKNEPQFRWTLNSDRSLTVKHTGGRMSIYNNSGMDGVDIVQYTSKDNPPMAHQKWNFIPV